MASSAFGSYDKSRQPEIREKKVEVRVFYAEICPGVKVPLRINDFEPERFPLVPGVIINDFKIGPFDCDDRR